MKTRGQAETSSDTRKPHILAVTSCRNRLEYTIKNINSVQKNRNPAFDLSHLVVDSGSTDGTREWLKYQTDVKSLPGLSYIENNSNPHHTIKNHQHAVELAMDFCDFDYLFVMASDTELLGSMSIFLLLKHHEIISEERTDLAYVIPDRYGKQPIPLLETLIFRKPESFFLETCPLCETELPQHPAYLASPAMSVCPNRYCQFWNGHAHAGRIQRGYGGVSFISSSMARKFTDSLDDFWVNESTRREALKSGNLSVFIVFASRLWDIDSYAGQLVRYRSEHEIMRHDECWEEHLGKNWVQTHLNEKKQQSE